VVEHTCLEEAAACTAVIVNALCKAEEPTSPSNPRNEKVSADAQDGVGSGSSLSSKNAARAEGQAEEANSPKTTEMPDVESLPLSRMRELIDIRDLPAGQSEKVWAILEQNIDMFGFNGRLGQHPAQAWVWLKERVQPIAVPMYSTSPAKKKVIKAQVKKWYGAGVIESPAARGAFQW
jgi:hypothetical protein